MKAPMEAWMIKSTAHGLSLSSLVFCLEGEGPDKQPQNWLKRTWVRLKHLEFAFNITVEGFQKEKLTR